MPDNQVDPIAKKPDQQQHEIELLIKAQCGDYDAYDSLYAYLAPQLKRFVRRLIGDSHEVEDIVQDTLISLYSSMDRIQPPQNLRPYVYRVARNRCYDSLRKQGRYEQESLDEPAVNLRVSFTAHENNSTPEDATHWLLLYLEVQEAIDTLPEAQRQALILFSEADMSYAEIADVMEVSIGTIKSRLFHAKRYLKRILKPETLKAIEGKI